MTRPTRPRYYLDIAEAVSRRATCDRKHVGAVIVNANDDIISTGFNGSPKGLPHCDDIGHELVEIDGRESCVRTLHAESNAIDRATKEGMRGSTLYVTVTPCYGCAKRIVNAGIVAIYYDEHYDSQKTELTLALFQRAGIDVRHYGG